MFESCSLQRDASLTVIETPGSISPSFYDSQYVTIGELTMSFNKIILVGNLGRDPELRYTPQGTPVCSFSLATNERRKDRNSGEHRDVTTWFRVTLWGRQRCGRNGHCLVRCSVTFGIGSFVHVACSNCE